MFVCLFIGLGRWLILTDSIGKNLTVNECCTLLAVGGDTLQRLTDRIYFGECAIDGYSRILIHVGTNDVSNSLKYGQ